MIACIDIVERKEPDSVAITLQAEFTSELPRLFLNASRAISQRVRINMAQLSATPSRQHQCSMGEPWGAFLHQP